MSFVAGPLRKVVPFPAGRGSSLPASLRCPDVHSRKRMSFDFDCLFPVFHATCHTRRNLWLSNVTNVGTDRGFRQQQRRRRHDRSLVSWDWPTRCLVAHFGRRVQLVADFTQQLSEIHDRHSEELQVLVEGFRKRNAEIRKERTPYQSTLFSVWELLLQEVEAESHSHGEVARFLSRNMGNGLLEKTFHRKIQSRKAFLHRESVEAILNKANEALETVRYTFFLFPPTDCEARGIENKKLQSKAGKRLRGRISRRGDARL